MDSSSPFDALPRDPAVAQAVTDIREAASLSQQELAATLGVPAWQIVAWERGWRDPCARSVAMLSRMAADGGSELLTALAGPRLRSSIVAADMGHLDGASPRDD